MKKGECIIVNLFCSMFLIKKYGGFNEKFKLGGDVEFSWCVVSFGGKVVYLEKVEVFYLFRNKLELIVKCKWVVGGIWDVEFFKVGFKWKFRFCIGLLKMFLGCIKKMCLYLGFLGKCKMGLIWLLLLIFFISLSEFMLF